MSLRTCDSTARLTSDVHNRALRGFKSGKYAFAGIRGKGTGAAQFPTESVSEQLAREQWQGDHGISCRWLATVLSTLLCERGMIFLSQDFEAKLPTLHHVCISIRLTLFHSLAPTALLSAPSYATGAE